MKTSIPYLRYVGPLLLVSVMLTGCETGFEDMNVNPTQANEISPDFIFPAVQLATAGTRYEVWRSNLIWPEAMVQHLSHDWYAGDRYIRSGNEDHQTAIWLVAYNGSGDPARAGLVQVTHLIEENRDDPLAVNKVAAARIMRAFIFSRLTDMYGDIPYFEAASGIVGDEITPVFDEQSAIYADMLKELEESVASFDDLQPTYGTADLMYGGDIEQWKKFAHSLMLRWGMRLTEVDVGMAQSWVQKAITGGVMTSNDDIAVVMHQNGPNVGPNGLNSNGIGDVFEVDSPQLGRRFVDWMKDTGDPRLPIFGAMYDAAAHGGAATVSTDPAEMFGRPAGMDTDMLEENDPNFDPDEGVYVSYAQPNRIVRGLDDPTFFMTFAEVNFLLAEAAVRNWHAGDPAALYEEGIRAAMQHVALYDSEGQADISDAEIDAYLAANPYDAGSGMELIQTQKWAALFLNGHEAWANWRRTGFPMLTPANYPGNESGGQVPRRITYPSNEQILNTENYQAAVSRQGPDNLTTRMWWDAE